MRLYTINPRGSRHLVAPLASITASQGTVSVVQTEGRVPAATLEQGETIECQGRASFTVSAISGGAKIGVVFADEAAEPGGQRARPRGSKASRKSSSKRRKTTSRGSGKKAG